MRFPPESYRRSCVSLEFILIMPDVALHAEGLAALLKACDTASSYVSVSAEAVNGAAARADNKKMS
jgi:hypothetical protein